VKAFIQTSILGAIIGVVLCPPAVASADSPASTGDRAATSRGAPPPVDEDEAIKKKLSTLWLVESLNIIGSDVLTSFIPGHEEELEDFAGGKENIKYFMLGGAVLYSIPISMTFLSRYLPRDINRWTNVGAAAVTATGIVVGRSNEPHYIFLASVQLLTLSYVTWTALRWPDSSAKRHDIGFHLGPDESRLFYTYRF